jgi:acetyl-CoA/propionyl-CoA carboxylase biotin carboxyl carrier protein
MLRALEEYRIEGVTTLLGFHRALLAHPCFVAGETCHGVVESEELAAEAARLSSEGHAAAPAADGRVQGRPVAIEVGGRRYDVTVLEPEPPHVALARRRRERTSTGGGHAAAREAVVSPMQGTVLSVDVSDGDEVSAGVVLCVIEAMKMENEIRAHRDGVVTGLTVAPGQAVATGQVICVVSANGAGDPAAG